MLPPPSHLCRKLSPAQGPSDPLPQRRKLTECFAWIHTLTVLKHCDFNHLRMRAARCFIPLDKDLTVTVDERKISLSWLFLRQCKCSVSGGTQSCLCLLVLNLWGALVNELLLGTAQSNRGVKQMTNYSTVPKWKQSTSPLWTYADFYLFVSYFNNCLLHLDGKDFSDRHSHTTVSCYS